MSVPKSKLCVPVREGVQCFFDVQPLEHWLEMNLEIKVFLYSVNATKYF